MQRTWIEYCNMIHKIFKTHWGHSPWSSATLGKYEKLTVLNPLKIHFQRFFALSFFHLISNGLNRVNSNWFMKIVALLQDLILCSISMPHQDIFWYHLNGMSAQKKCPKVSCNVFSIYISRKWNIVYEYLKTKIFSGYTNIVPQMQWTSNIFGHSATANWSF